MTEERPSILIVDDEPEFVELLSAYLAGDYQVTTAYGGEAALEHADTTIDVISLDRRMPDLSGDEVVTRLRKDGWPGGILMVSAVERRDPDLAGWDDYLEKPVFRDEYRSAIDGLLADGED